MNFVRSVISPFEVRNICVEVARDMRSNVTVRTNTATDFATTVAEGTSGCNRNFKNFDGGVDVTSNLKIPWLPTTYLVTYLLSPVHSTGGSLGMAIFALPTRHAQAETE